jgi:hypothetical protein
MLGGGNSTGIQQGSSSQKIEKGASDDVSLNQNDLDDDIPF